MIRKTALATMFAAMVSACTVGPDYQRPDVTTPAAWRTESAASVVKSVEVTDQWWLVFNDPQLNELVDIALAENKDLQIAASRVAQAMATVTVVNADRLPTVGAGAEATRSQPSELANRPPVTIVNNFQVMVNASFELDIWGKYRRASEGARASLLATQYGRDTVRISLISGVVQSYFQLRGADAQLIVLKQTLETRKKSLALQKKRYDNGLTSELEYRQAEVEYQAILSQVPQAEIQVAQLENALSILLGRNPGNIQRGLPVDKLAPVPEVPAGLPSDLLLRRPDIRQAEETLIAANAQIGVAKAAYFPSISLTGLFGSQSLELSDLFKGPSKVWQFGGAVSMPIFTGGRIRGGVELAEARAQEMLLNYQKTIQIAFREVDDAIIAYQKLKEAYDIQLKQYVATKRLVQIAQRRYHHGLISYLEVLDAERNLHNLEAALIATQQTRLIAFVGLNTALGGGWLDPLVQPEQVPADGAKAG